MKKNKPTKKKVADSPVMEDARMASLMGRKRFNKMKERMILSGHKEEMA